MGLPPGTKNVILAGVYPVLINKWLHSIKPNLASLLGILGCFLPLPVNALVFPLPLGPNGEYDVHHNVLPAYSSGWSNQHAVLNFHGANAVAIAPRWFITADHLVGTKDGTFWVNDDQNRYYLVEKHVVGPDLAVVRVDRPFPFYSEIRKTPVLSNEVITVYGQSAAAGAPIFNEQLKHAGWKLAPPNHRPALRWGQGRAIGKSPSPVQWTFQAGDPLLGEGGLNCAGTATNDSGGGIFVQTQLAAVTIGGSFSAYRTNILEPRGNCDSFAGGTHSGHIFRTDGIYQCFGNAGIQPVASGSAVYPQLPSIFAAIAPELLINVGGPSLTNEAAPWISWLPDGANSFSDPGFVAHDIRNAAPPEVYQSEIYLEGQPKAAITFVADELIRYEKYTVRLHFSSLHTARQPNRSLQTIEVNGQSITLDPHAGKSAASYHTFFNIHPDENSRITISITPANEFGNATLSGIEIKIIPAWPSEPLPFQSTTVHTTSSDVHTLAYGNGVFVGLGNTGVYFSEDNAETWFPASNVPRNFFWSLFSPEVTFGAGTFIVPAPSTAGLLVSVDGREWTQSQLPGATAFHTVLSGNGLFVAASYTRLFISRDGLSWELVQQAPPLMTGAFGANRFIFCGFRDLLLHSTNGVNWETLPLQLPPPPDPRCAAGQGCDGPPPEWLRVDGLTFGNAIFALSMTARVEIQSETGPQLSNYPIMLVSTDGVHWRFPGDDPRFPPVGGRISFVHDRFVFPWAQQQSSNLIDFQRLTNILGLTYGNSLYVAAGNRSSILSGPSINELKPIPGHFRQRSFSGLVSDNSRTGLVLLNSTPGAREPIVYTPDNRTFRRARVPSYDHLPNALQFGAGKFITTGPDGVILASSNGLDWTNVPSGTSQNLHDAAYGDQTWVAVGENGAITLASVDAASFKLQPPISNRHWRSIAYGHGLFAAVGDRGLIATSPDGNSWTLPPPEQTNDLFAIAYGENHFVAVGTNGTIVISPDGRRWQAARVASGQSLFSVEYGSGAFVALERNSTNALFSHDALSWAMFQVPPHTLQLGVSSGQLWFCGTNAFLGRAVGLGLSVSKPGVVRAVAPHPGPFRLLTSDSPGGPWRTLTTFTNTPSWSWPATNQTTPSFFKLRYN